MAPADFAQNMDLVTERSAPKTTVGSLTSLFGPVVAPCISQSLGAATAADQAAIEKAAKWYRGAAGTCSVRVDVMQLSPAILLQWTAVGLHLCWEAVFVLLAPADFDD